MEAGEAGGKEDGGGRDCPPPDFSVSLFGEPVVEEGTPLNQNYSDQNRDKAV